MDGRTMVRMESADRLRGAPVPHGAVSELDAFERGAVFLGSGGGGVHPGYRLMVAARGVSTVESRAMADADDPVALGIVGSTDLFAEMLPSGSEIEAALRGLEHTLGRAFTAVLPLQIGGMSAMAAYEAACSLGLPLVDADMVGRAVTHLNQVSLDASRGDLVAAASGPLGSTVTVRTHGLARLEAALRSLVRSQGGWQMVAVAMADRRLDRADVITGTVREAVVTGRSLLNASRWSPAQSLEHVPQEMVGELELARIRVVASARIESVTRHRTARGARGRTVLLTGNADRATIRVEAAGEYLVLLMDGRVEAVSPDIIQLVDRLTLLPVGSEKLRSGEEVLVLTRPGPEWWHRDPDRLSRVSPQAYGLGALV